MMNCLINNHTHKFTNPTEFLFLIIITISALTSANLQSIQRTKSSKPQTWGLNNLIHSIIHLFFFRNGDRKPSTQSTGSGSSDHQSQEGSPSLSPEQRDRKGEKIML